MVPKTLHDDFKKSHMCIILATMKNCEIPGSFEDTLTTLLRANDLPAIKLGGITPPILTSLLPISADVPPPHSADVPPPQSSDMPPPLSADVPSPQSSDVPPPHSADMSPSLSSDVPLPSHSADVPPLLSASAADSPPQQNFSTEQLNDSSANANMSACQEIPLPTVNEIKIYKRSDMKQKLSKRNISRLAQEGKVAAECNGTNESVCFDILSKFNGSTFPNVEVLSVDQFMAKLTVIKRNERSMPCETRRASRHLL